MDSLVETAMEMFDATIIESVYPAADQDGFDGGWCADDGARREWGKTPAQASFRLKMAKAKASAGID